MSYTKERFYLELPLKAQRLGGKYFWSFNKKCSDFLCGKKDNHGKVTTTNLVIK
jgi:hypothetical protein